MPITECNRTIVAPAGNPDGSAFLLTTVKPIRKTVISCNVIELRGGLVVPRTPCLPAVNGNDRTLVTAERYYLRVRRINPNVLVIVAARGASPSIPCPAAIG